jgi:hypothetical protein
MSRQEVLRELDLGNIVVFSCVRPYRKTLQGIQYFSFSAADCGAWIIHNIENGIENDVEYYGQTEVQVVRNEDDIYNAAKKIPLQFQKRFIESSLKHIRQGCQSKGFFV